MGSVADYRPRGPVDRESEVEVELYVPVPPSVAVPRVSGSDLPMAMQTIHSACLDVGNVFVRFDDSATIGNVGYTQPEEGQEAPTRSEVTLYVDTRRFDAGDELNTVTAVTSQPLRTALRSLYNARVNPGRVIFRETEAACAGREPGTVTRQDPVEFTRVNRRTPVALYVCLPRLAR